MKRRSVQSPRSRQARANRLRKSRNGLITLLLVLLAAACNPQAVTPTPPVTLGMQNPKVLVTVYISPTPPVRETSTPVPGVPATPSGPPTATPTPYVGVFLGETAEIAIEGTYVVPTSLPRPIDVATPASADTPACSTPPAPHFQDVWARNAALNAALGCPVNAGFGTRLVYQPFEHGHMFYHDTGDIYALSTQSIQTGGQTDIYWQIADTWQEDQPESDPNLTPPEGKMQPIRGFGNAWRNTPLVRNALGWATAPERWIDGHWQDFEGGWMVLGPNGQVFGFTTPTDGTGAHFGALGP